MAALTQMLTIPLPPQWYAGQEVAAPKPVLAAHPLQSRLCERLLEVGGELIDSFMRELDPAVQALLAECRNAAETRAVLDLGNALSLNRPALLRGFMAALKRRFDPLRVSLRSNLFDLERLSLLPADEMEENMQLSQLALQAEQKASEAGRQLASRLQAAARDLALPALDDALDAHTLPDCFAQAFRHAGLMTSERVLAYRLVECHALKAWPSLVQAALLVLDQQGLHGAHTLAGHAAANAAQDAAPMISAATMQTLREVRASLVSGEDGRLASALLRALEPPFVGSPVALITALAGSWMDSLLAESELPATFTPELESLRLPVIKAALCDLSFFLQPLHPVRQSVNDAAQKAAFVGLQGYSLAQVRAELREIASRINIHGRFALDALQMLPPLDPDLAHQFHQQMSRDQEHRRESLLHRVRALATREVEARTLDVSLPSAARAALSRGFMPLLSTLMLRHGSAAPPTRQARQLLERFVDSFALCIGRSERQSVLSALCKTLVETGLSELHTRSVRAELETAYAELEAEAQSSLPGGDSSSTLREINSILSGLGVNTTAESRPAPPVVTAGASQYQPKVSLDDTPLERLLKPGQWFRVRDYKSGDDRWLSLVGLHTDQDRVSFSGFDGITVLTMRASQFVEDLTTGLAEPLNPDASVQQALVRLRTRPVETPALLCSFG